MRRKRRGAIFFVIVILLGAGIFVALKAASGPSLTPAQIAAQKKAAAIRALIAKEKSVVRTAASDLTVTLPKKYNEAAPTTPATLFKKPLGTTNVMGFIPYYALSDMTAADYADATELVYSGIQINADGTLELPVSFVGLSTSTFANFNSNAHTAHDQVLLSVSAFSKTVIDALAKNPVKTATLLASEISPLLSTYGLQGVNIDVEGRWANDRAGFTTFTKTFVTAIRASDPSSVIVVDSFPQSAAIATSFYDFKALTPYVNDFFIMAYAMYSSINSSANSPAFAPNLNLSDVQSLLQYVKVAPRSKLIMGLPFYGFDFATESSRANAYTSSNSPEAETYSAVVSAGEIATAKWDPVSETPYNVHRSGQQWHQTWFDDPVSIALKASLVKQFHIGGIGVWTLGMEAGDPQMLAALDGESPVKKLALAS